ncbi:MAG TPA: PH domain-containing protein [Propioniciclava tarda]|nr:PH domain-containing protein [Propioniciclava tarda]HQD60798.1 PH domain-containing protein [Propioniciclava tarda]
MTPSDSMPEFLPPDAAGVRSPAEQVHGAVPEQRPTDAGRPDFAADRASAWPAEKPTEDGAAPAASGSVLTEERPHPLTPIVQVWVWLVAMAIFFGRQFIENRGEIIPADLGRFPWWLLIVGAVGLVSVAWNLWTWWTTRFIATASEFRVEHKGVEHESKRIAYQRIQSVDVTQRFAARLLGMAEVTIDVGGDAPVRLQYLSRTRAVELRDFLMRRAHGLTPSTAAAAAGTSAWDDRGVHDRVLLTVPAGELVLGAALSHELLLLVLAAAIPLVIGVVTATPLLIGGGILPIAISIASFLSSRVLGQFRYTLAQTPAGLRITRGLTSLTSETVPVHRVQAIRIHEPVLWRLIGRARVDLSFLGLRGITTNEDGAGASSIMLPIGNRQAVDVALRALWPDVDLDAIALRPGPRAARWISPLGWRFIACGWDARVLVVRSGWLTRTTWVVPHARVQSVRTTTGPVRRKLGIATIEVHTSDVFRAATTVMAEPAASEFAFAELDRARQSRQRAMPTLDTPAEGASESLGFSHG